MKRFHLSLLFSFLFSLPAMAVNDSIRYEAEVGATFAGGKNTPFWLMNNQYGLSSRIRNNGYLRLGAFHDIDTARRFSWGAGADLAVAARFTSAFVVQQLYGEVKYRCLNALAGAKEIPGYINNPELSSGNLMYSGNARPVPQVRVGIFDYADVWGCKGWFGVKGYLAFGKFTDSRWVEHWAAPESKYVTGTLYHSKALFLRFGDLKRKPLQFELGMEMATEFGGTEHVGDKTFKMPTGFKDWIKAIIPMKGGDNTTESDQMNVQGNMLGAWNFALTWAPKSVDWRVKLYYEHYFEDHSMMTFDYLWKDGQYGLEVKFPKNRWVSDFVYEFLYMKDQAGTVYWDHTPEVPEQVSGADNYYNHDFYNGWEHWGMNIGTPLAISPIYNNDHIMTCRSNRFRSHHIGFRGQPTDELGYRILGTYTKSWGTMRYPFKEAERNINLLVEVNYKPKRLKGWEGTLAFGADGGGLLGRSYGAMIRISKTGFFNFRR